MVPLPMLLQENFVTGPPEEVQLRVNTGGSSSGPEVSVNGVPVQSTVGVPAEDSGRDWVVQPLLKIRLGHSKYHTAGNFSVVKLSQVQIFVNTILSHRGQTVVPRDPVALVIVR